MIELPLRNRHGEVVATALLDDADAHLTSRPWYRLANGYAVRTERRDGRKQMLYLHREVLGAARGQVVDHRDGNKLDNRRTNIRLATPKLNAQNRGANGDRTLPRGVRWRKDAQCFEAFAKSDGRWHYLGLHPTIEQADAAASTWRAEHMPWSPDAVARR